MNNKLVTLLTATCGVLLLVIIGEWFYAKMSQQQLLSSSAPKTAKIAQDEMPSIELDGQSEDSYVDFVSRPLFIEGRRPVNETLAANAQNNQIAVKFDWLLNGVYTTSKGGLSAFMTRANPTLPKRDNYRKVTVGQMLDGWKLAEIFKDKVVFIQDATQKELTLRKPKPKQAQPKQGNPAQPPQVPETPEPPEGTLPPELEQPEPVDESLENSDNEQF